MKFGGVKTEHSDSAAHQECGDQKQKYHDHRLDAMKMEYVVPSLAPVLLLHAANHVVKSRQ